MHFTGKNINFNKTKWNGKWEVPYRVLKRQTLYFSSYKYQKLKVNP